jgi:hypothetical protein
MRLSFSINCLTLFLAIRVLGAEAAKSSPPPFEPPPIPPAAKSRVDSFRELLDMKPAERTNALAKKSEKYRRVIEERLSEFDGLPLDQRQARLRLMQLRWEVFPLLSTPEPMRTAIINSLPEADRPLVSERLRYWDNLSNDVKKLILENETVLHYFITGGQYTTPTVSSNTIPPSMATNINRWRELTPAQQQEAYDRFRELFGLGQKDREKLFEENLLLGRSPAQQERIKRMLKSLEALPPDQREKRMKSFQRFTSMTMQQRLEFLQKAERWENMPEAEKDLLRKMPPLPPFPPGFLIAPVMTNVSCSTNQ